MISGSNPGVILQLTLSFMYFSWVFGLSMDFNTQSMVYISDPRRGKISGLLYVNILVLFVVAVTLLWARKNDKYFAVALSFFSVVCLWSLFSARSGVIAIIEHSRAAFESHSDWFGKEQLEIVKNYGSSGNRVGGFEGS